MSKSPTTVEGLARELGSDSDEVLLALWDAGIDYPKGPKSSVRHQDLARARDACGLANGRELARVDYWLKRDRISREDFVVRLNDLGIHLSPNARALPKGAVARLRSAFPAPSISLSIARKDEVSTIERRPFFWRQIGHVREVRGLSLDEIVDVHFALAADFADSADPVSPAGVREPGLLQSALTRPETSLGTERKYQTVELATSALTHSLVHNHAFYNGNKRTALVSMLSMLDRNGLIVMCTQDDLFKWMIRVAQHSLGADSYDADRSDVEVSLMASWIKDNSRLLDRGEKVMTWQFLRRRLHAFDCETTITGTGGGRIMIQRQVDFQRRGALGISRSGKKLLRFQMAYAGDGRDVAKSDMKELRRELWLDDEHGIDSAMFYGIDSTPPDQFIADYRKTLVRLAKL